MTWIGQVMAVARKDLLVEWRTPSRVSGVFFFALALLLMVAFAAGSSTAVLRKQAAGTLWIGLLLASTRSFDQSFASENEEGALEGMVLWPVHPSAVFYGKALANAAVLGAVGLALVPLTIALFDASIEGSVPLFALFVALGCTALSAPGTLYAVITSQARGASVLLPLLLFPLVVPALIAAARGASVVMEGDPMGQAGSWLRLLLAFNLLHWSLTGLLFARVVDDG